MLADAVPASDPDGEDDHVVLRRASGVLGPGREDSVDDLLRPEP
jgi:hypothetical protein